jgi:hypothetical protein
MLGQLSPWSQGTGFPRTLPSAMSSAVDHRLGSPSRCFPQLPSAKTSTVDHRVGFPYTYMLGQLCVKGMCVKGTGAQQEGPSLEEGSG